MPTTYGTSVDPVTPPAPVPQLQRPLQPPPPPPLKQKPPVPRKPPSKRVSFISDTQDVPERQHMTNDPNANAIHVPHDKFDELTKPATAETNDACEGVSSLLIRNRTAKTDTGVSRPVLKASPVLPEDLIIPPPPLFDIHVSDFPSVKYDRDESRSPLISIIPERLVLPEPVVAETSMQSSTSTDSPETEFPPAVNYEAYPEFYAASSIRSAPTRSPIISEVPSYQVFRTSEVPSFISQDYHNELSVSPGVEIDPPELLQAHYKVLPTVSHVPNSPCSIHPDKTYFQDNNQNPLNVSLRDLRTKNIPSAMVHSDTFPTINPYPSLTTVAGTYNPYTCAVPICSTSTLTQSGYTYQKSQVLPPLVHAHAKDINANVTRTTSIVTSDSPRNSQTERRVRFGEVTTAPEHDLLSHESESLREGSSSPASTLKPAWSSKLKAFAIGEVNINVRILPSHNHLHSAYFDCVRRQPKSKA